MRSFRLGVAFGLLPSLWLAAAPAAAQTELKNDSFADAQVVAFQGGFVAGEMAGARFVPAGPCTITKIQILFGGGATTHDVTLHIYDDATGNPIPGTELMTPTTVSLTGNSSAWNELDMSQIATVTATGPFRIAFEWTHAGYPSVARDNDGNTYPDRNFLKEATLGWRQSSFFGVTGDWVIRAFVEYSGQEDAGVPEDAAPQVDAAPAADAGPQADAGAPGCQSNTECPAGQYCGSQSVCTQDCVVDNDCAGGATCNSLGQCVAKSSGGCAVTPGRPLTSLGFLAALALAALVRRRRRL
jgi:MYXO-CTERM domain-containing protein